MSNSFVTRQGEKSVLHALRLLVKEVFFSTQNLQIPTVAIYFDFYSRRWLSQRMCCSFECGR
jgi:hypothetical protein